MDVVKRYISLLVSGTVLEPKKKLTITYGANGDAEIAMLAPNWNLKIGRAHV